MRHRWGVGILFAAWLAGCGTLSAPAQPATSPAAPTGIGAPPAATPIPPEPSPSPAPAASTAPPAATPTRTAPLTPQTELLPAAEIPSGSLLYVALDEPSQSADVWLVRPAALGGDNTPLRLTDCISENCSVTGFALAPDKTRLAYAVTSNESFRAALRLRDLATGAETTPRPDADGIKQLAFAPDGARLAYLTERTDTTAPVPPTEFNLLDLATQQSSVVGAEEIFVADLAWSRDGASLLYSKAETGLPPQQWNIYRLPLAGAAASVAANGGRLLAQSPDGQRWLVLVEITSERFGLGVHDLASDRLTQFELGELFVYDADWNSAGLIAAIASPGPTAPTGIAVFPGDADALPPPRDTGPDTPVAVAWLGDETAAFVSATPRGSALSTARLAAGAPPAGQALVVPDMGYGLPLWGTAP